MSKFRKREVLVIAKTYPLPQPKTRESVCTAAIDRNGNFIRLYPIPFRYLHKHQQYKKYQWITVDIKKSLDHRIESYTPNLDTIRLNKIVDTKDNWKQRMSYIFPYVSNSIEELTIKAKKNKISLGIIKPYRIKGLVIEPTEREWPEKWMSILKQRGLFDNIKEYNLQKIPYKFKYEYYCNTKCKGHKQQILDWELGALYNKIRDKNGEDKAKESVYKKYLLQMCAYDRETYLIVGTLKKHPTTWNVLGVIWPKKEYQTELI